MSYLKRTNSVADLNTIHAEERSLERNISEEAIFLTLSYGEMYETSHGRIAYWFNKPAADKCALPWSAKKDAYNVAVIQASDGAVITVMQSFVKKQDWLLPLTTYRRA